MIHWHTKLPDDDRTVLILLDVKFIEQAFYIHNVQKPGGQWYFVDSEDYDPDFKNELNTHVVGWLDPRELLALEIGE